MSVTIKLRKGLASEWASNDTIILASGEPGFELDTGRLKIGDGTSTWTNLDYVSIVPTGFAAGTGIGIDLGSNGSSATISVSGLINNPANNRILTSRDNTNTGIDAESNLTFDGSTLSIIGGPTATSLNMGHGGDQYFNLVQGSTSASGYLALGQHATVQTSPFNIAINNANNYSRTQTTDLVAVSGNFTVLDVDNLRLDGNTISSTNTNGDVIVTPNGSGVLDTPRLYYDRSAASYADYDSIDGDIDFETTGQVSAIEASSTILVDTSFSISLLNLFGNSIDGEIKTFFNIGPGTLTVSHRYWQTEGDIVTPGGTDIVLGPGGAVTLQNVYHPAYSENNWIVIGCCNNAGSSSSI